MVMQMNTTNVKNMHLLNTLSRNCILFYERIYRQV